MSCVTCNSTSNSDYIVTPYYRNLVEDNDENFSIKYQKLVEDNYEQSSNGYNPYQQSRIGYNPYSLFVIRTNLQPLVDGYDINFPTILRDNRLIITVQILSDGNPITFDKKITDMLQKKVNNITDNYALLISYDPIITSKVTVPTYWIEKILPYIDIQIPTKVDLDGLKVDLSKIGDYSSFYDNLLLNTTEMLISMYESGYTVSPTKSMILNWDLSEDKDLYRPLWDLPYLHLTYEHLGAFLRTRLLGEKIILKSEQNWVFRHEIAKLYPDVTFYNDVLMVNINNLDQLRTLIFHITNFSSGEKRVIPYVVTEKKNDGVYYKSGKDLIKSIEVPNDVKSVTIKEVQSLSPHSSK